MACETNELNKQDLIEALRELVNLLEEDNVAVITKIPPTEESSRAVFQVEEKGTKVLILTIEKA